MELYGMFQAERENPGVSVIYGTAITDSVDGTVMVQVGDPLPAASFGEDALDGDYEVEMDDMQDSDTTEDEQADIPYWSDEPGADNEHEGDVAADGTYIEDSEELGADEGEDPMQVLAVDEEDPLTETIEE